MFKKFINKLAPLIYLDILFLLYSFQATADFLHLLGISNYRNYLHRPWPKLILAAFQLKSREWHDFSQLFELQFN